MAQKVEVILVDDLDGSEAKETATFGLDARFYEIDLSEEHAKELRETLKKYIRRGRAIAPPSPQNEARQIKTGTKFLPVVGCTATSLRPTATPRSASHFRSLYLSMGPVATELSGFTDVQR